jgi:cytochrome P450
MTPTETPSPSAPPVSARSARPARPPWRAFGKLQRLFSRDLLGALTHMTRTYGGLVRTRLPLHIYFAGDPAIIEEILVRKADSFRKDRVTRLLGRVVGNGLLVNEGDSWRHQRRLIQPAFHHQQLQSYPAMMVAATERSAATWAAGQLRDVHQDMMEVTLDIVAQALFGADVSGQAGRIGHALFDLMEEFGKLMGLSARFALPAWVPTPANRRLRRAVRDVDDVIHGIIAERRASTAGDRHDLLSLLIQTRDEDGQPMSDTQVRDEAVMLFLAGHETTALTLTYALYLLAAHPEKQALLKTELDRVLGDRVPALGDLEGLVYTENVVLESMRLYPPAWAMGREALAPVEIAGFSFPKGAEFVISPWVMHRDPRFFNAPETFQPERWENDLARRLPKFAYLPFGGGPRICIGNRFAMMEAKLALATIARRFRFELDPETKVDLFPSVTLRPRGGLKLRLAAHAAGPA